MKKAGVFAIIASAALVLSACGSSNSTSSDSKKESDVKSVDYLKADYDQLKDGGEVKFSIGEVADQQNRFHADGSSYVAELWSWYNPQVILFNDKFEFEPNPEYLDDVKEETVDGKTVVTYTIKQEATFNDGTPIDYRAFENTWKSNNGEDEAYNISSDDGYKLIESVTKGDSDKVAVVTFKQPYAWWQSLFNQILHPAINSAELFDTYYTGGDVEKFNAYGAGPYKMETFDVSTGKATFVPNEKWWGRPAKLERVTFTAMDPSADINAFSNGEIDSVSARNAERYGKVKDLKGVKIYKAMAHSNALFMINSGNEFLKDIKVRQAIMEGIDRSQIAKVAFQGLDYSEPLPGSLALFEYQKGYEDNYSKAAKFDADASKKLLDEAGWKAGSDGVREKDGKKLTLTYVYFGDSSTVIARAKAFQQQLKNIGIDVKVEQRSTQDFTRTYTEKDFDLFFMGFSSSDPFGVAYFGQMYRSGSTLNLSGTGTADFDKKIDELEQIDDPDAQIKKANELEVEAFKQYGVMPVFVGANIAATKEGLANYTVPTDGTMGFSVAPVETVGWVK